MHGAAHQRGLLDNLRRRAAGRGGGPLPSAANATRVGRAPPAHSHRRLHGDLRPGGILELRGYGEGTVYLGETRLTVGEATWKRITRGMVEVLVGEEV